MDRAIISPAFYFWRVHITTKSTIQLGAIQWPAFKQINTTKQPFNITEQQFIYFICKLLTKICASSTNKRVSLFHVKSIRGQGFKPSCPILPFKGGRELGLANQTNIKGFKKFRGVLIKNVYLIMVGKGVIPNFSRSPPPPSFFLRFSPLSRSPRCPHLLQANQENVSIEKLF